MQAHHVAHGDDQKRQGEGEGGNELAILRRKRSTASRGASSNSRAEREAACAPITASRHQIHQLRRAAQDRDRTGW
jgi:hypothetical protein